MQIDVLDTKGKKIGKLKASDQLFAVEADPKLMAQAVRVYLANQRQVTAKVKNRGEVSGSGKKIWRQKGTGRARHGDRYAPIFVGGGIAHGPDGKQNYKLKLSKKMRLKALSTALTQKLKQGELLVVDGLDKKEPKTKIMEKVLDKLVGELKKILIVTPLKSEAVVRSAKNIQGVRIISANRLNAYELLKAKTVIIMKPAYDLLDQTFLKSDKKPKKTQAQAKKRSQPQKPKRTKTAKNKSSKNNKSKK